MIIQSFSVNFQLRLYGPTIIRNILYGHKQGIFYIFFMFLRLTS